MSLPVILALIVIVVPMTIIAVGAYILLRTVAKVAREAAAVAGRLNAALEQHSAPSDPMRSNDEKPQ